MKKGFTLIELMLVIAILGILTTLISGNFITSLKKGRDAKRKADIQNIQRAFEMYFEDISAFPASNVLSDTTSCDPNVCICHPNGCTTKIYMAKVPTDPSTEEAYVYVTDAQRSYYVLYSCIENTNDTSSGIKLNGSQQDPNGWGVSCGTCGVCKFKIESSNAP